MNKEIPDFTVELDTFITKELQLEGISNEITRQINSYRKELNLTTSQIISINIEVEDEIVKETIISLNDNVLKRTQSKSLELKKCREHIKEFIINVHPEGKQVIPAKVQKVLVKVELIE